MDVLVQQLKIQNGTDTTSLLRYKEVRGVETMAVVVQWNRFYGTLVEEGTCFLLKKMVLGGIS